MKGHSSVKEKCSDCSLSNDRKMLLFPEILQTTIGKSKTTMVIIDSPTKSDDKFGFYLSNNYYKEMREKLSKLTGKIILTSLVKCPSSRKKITKKQIRTCNKYLMFEIEYYKPDFIITIGSIATREFIECKNILTESGTNHVVIVRSENKISLKTIIIPILHPASILHPKYYSKIRHEIIYRQLKLIEDPQKINLSFNYQPKRFNYLQKWNESWNRIYKKIGLKNSKAQQNILSFIVKK